MLSFTERANHCTNKAATYEKLAGLLSEVENPTEDQQMEHAIALSKAEKWAGRAKTFEASAATEAQEKAQREQERKGERNHSSLNSQDKGKSTVTVAMKPLLLPANFKNSQPLWNALKLDEKSKLTLDEIRVPEQELSIETPIGELLPDLARFERTAGLGGSDEYSKTYSREMMNLMHQQGAQMPLHHLESIFTHGLFNYYFNLYCGLNPNFEKKEWIISEHADRLFGGTKPLFLVGIKHRESFRARTYEILHFLARASEKLKENPYLRYLGSIFQKQKVRVELLEKNQDLTNLVLESQRVELQQLVLARWMQTVAWELQMDLRRHLRDLLLHQPLQATDAFVESLPLLRPKFLDDPFYARAFNLLKTTDFGPDLDIPEAVENYKKYSEAGFKLKLNCVQERAQNRW